MDLSPIMSGKEAFFIEGGATMGLALVERLHNMVVICRDEKVIYINETGFKMMGCTDRGQLIGKRIAEFFHSDYQQFAELGLELFAEEKGLISTKFMRLDSGDVDVEIWVSQLTDEAEPTFLLEARDVTAHLKAARALHEREKRLEGIINTVADGIITVNDKGIIESFNPAAEKIFGFSADEVLGKSLRDLIPAPTLERLDGHETTELANEWLKVIGPEQEIVAQRKDGNVIELEMAVRELRQGDQVAFTSIVRDITKRKEAERLIQQMAHYDNLTGLPNRYLFGDRLEKAIQRTQRHHSFMALMFVDLDRFKPINDELGHAAGDTVLKEVAVRLLRHVRATDTVARVGGDEFVIILEELGDAELAGKVAEKILEAFCEPIQLGEHQRTVGASIGISVCPLDGVDLKVITECADEAMYAAKKAGRACYRFYGPEVHAEAAGRND